jgi:PAS domain S-box-containing protein
MTGPWAARYAGALVLAGAGAVLHALLDTYAGTGYPLTGASAAVLVAAWLLGAGPALLAAGAGLLAHELIFARGAIPPLPDLVLYGLFTVLMCGLAAHREHTEARHLVRYSEAHRARNTLNALLESIPEGVLIVDYPESTVRFVSRRGAEISGVETSRLIGQRLSDLMDRWATLLPDGARLRHEDRPFSRVLESGEPVVDREFILERPDGVRVPVIINGAAIFGPARAGRRGPVVGAVMVYRDITKRKAAQAALAESAVKYQLLFEQAAFPKWLVDLETLAFVEANDAAVRAYGYTREEFLRMTLADLRAPAEPPTELEQHHTPAEHFEGTMSTRHRTRDGAVLNVEVTARVIDLRFGSRTMLVESFDTTSLVRSQHDLNLKAAELTRSNAELEQFAHAAAHDLKEPLRGLALYASFLKEDFSAELPPEAVRMINTISRLAARGTALVDALLDLSQAGRTQLRITTVNLDALFNEVVENLATLAAEQHALISKVGPLPAIRCDRVQVGRILANLIINGIKYNHRDPKVIEVGCYADPARPHPVVYVRDNGIGIKPEHHANIFNMFRRLHPADAYGGGTGAGLALVQMLVRRHAGEVWVESTPGEGSTFYFTVGPAADTPGPQ